MKSMENSRKFLRLYALFSILHYTSVAFVHNIDIFGSSRTDHPKTSLFSTESRDDRGREEDIISKDLLQRRAFLSKSIIPATVSSLLGWTNPNIPEAQARGLVIFPCRDYKFLNTYHFARAGESLLEEEGVLSTNPLFLTNREAALSPNGIEQVEEMCEKLRADDMAPTIVRYSLAASAIDSSDLIGKELKVGRDKLVPEFNFMDPRAIGSWDMSQMDNTLPAIWAMDADEGGRDGVGGRPPSNEDGTPNETLADQVVRLRQLISVLETQYSGDTILLVFPDGTGPALLTCLIGGIPLNRVHELEFRSGELRPNITYKGAHDYLSKEPSEEYKEIILRGRERLKSLRENPDEVQNVRDIEYAEQLRRNEDMKALLVKEEERKKLEMEKAKELRKKEKRARMEMAEQEKRLKIAEREEKLRIAEREMKLEKQRANAQRIAENEMRLEKQRANTQNTEEQEKTFDFNTIATISLAVIGAGALFKDNEDGDEISSHELPNLSQNSTDVSELPKLSKDGASLPHEISLESKLNSTLFKDNEDGDEISSHELPNLSQNSTNVSELPKLSKDGASLPHEISLESKSNSAPFKDNEDGDEISSHELPNLSQNSTNVSELPHLSKDGASLPHEISLESKLNSSKTEDNLDAIISEAADCKEATGKSLKEDSTENENEQRESGHEVGSSKAIELENQSQQSTDTREEIVPAAVPHMIGALDKQPAQAWDPNEDDGGLAWIGSLSELMDED